MKWVLGVFLALYTIAVAWLAIGTFGWFGQPQDPLYGVFLLPLGLPWNVLGDKLGLASPILGISAPLVNAVLLYVLYRYRLS
jgi:hypothetical protein